MRIGIFPDVIFIRSAHALRNPSHEGGMMSFAAIAFPVLLWLHEPPSGWSRLEGGSSCVQETTAERSEQRSRSDHRARFDGIVNRNPVPMLVGQNSDLHPIFDLNYDWAEYSRVWNAVRELSPDAEGLWSELVSHLDDDRYCLTAKTWSGNTTNLTVGDVCQRLIADCLSQPYLVLLEPGSLGTSARMTWWNSPGARGMLKSWCEKRKHLKLHELQIESCHWAAAQLAIAETLPRVSGTTRRAWIKSIQELIKTLEDSRKPLSCEWFRGEEFEPYNAESEATAREMVSEKKRGGGAER